MENENEIESGRLHVESFLALVIIVPFDDNLKVKWVA